MEAGLCSSEKQRGSEEEEEEEAEIDQLRKGPWTVEEDLVLMNYIAIHGEGRWNALARCAGLKRTGKSCRLRWLNYLHPDVRRGNITPEEQLLILDLQSRWGNRWSKIAKHLPGRTDNEIKNFWRTRVKKQARKLRCEVNSQQFKDTVRYIWVPHLLERTRAADAAATHFHHPITSSKVAVGPLEEEQVISFVPEVQQYRHAGGGATVTAANSMSINATDSYESDGTGRRVVSLMESDLDNDGKNGIMTTQLGGSSQFQDDHHDVIGRADKCWAGDANDGFYEGAGLDIYWGEIPARGVDGEAYQYQGDYAWNSNIDEVWFNWQHQFSFDGF